MPIGAGWLCTKRGRWLDAPEKPSTGEVTHGNQPFRSVLSFEAGQELVGDWSEEGNGHPALGERRLGC